MQNGLNSYDFEKRTLFNSVYIKNEYDGAIYMRPLRPPPDLTNRDGRTQIWI